MSAIQKLIPEKSSAPADFRNGPHPILSNVQVLARLHRVPRVELTLKRFAVACTVARTTRTRFTYSQTLHLVSALSADAAQAIATDAAKKLKRGMKVTGTCCLEVA